MKLREIERLRAIAILMVMTLHWGAAREALPEIARSTWAGVDLFFAISGYVVSLSLLRAMPALEGATSFAEAFDQARGTLRAFYVRRFFRIMPAALAVMIAYRCAGSAFPEQFGAAHEWNEEAVAFLGGIYNYAHAFHPQYRLGVYWSLAVEEHFYLLLPMVFVACRTKSRRLAACLVIALGSILARGLAPPEGANPEYYLKFASHLRFDSLMAGVALALVAGETRAAPLMPPAFMRWVLLPGALLIIALLPGAVGTPVILHQGLLAIAMLSGLVVFYASLDRGYVLPIPGLGRVLEYVGSRSYALYLSHMFVVRLEDAGRLCWPPYAALVPRTAYGRIPILLAAALLVSELVHRGVERPFMRLGRRAVDGQGPPLTFPRRARLALAGGAVLLALFASRHRLLLALGPPDLALDAAATASSEMEGKPGPGALTNGELEREFGLHTKEEDGPWATIDLGQQTDIGALRIYNRDDGYQDRILPLEVLASADDVHFDLVSRREAPFTQEWPWRVGCDGLRARYVRLRVAGHAALCLSEVEIFDDEVMAEIP